MISFNVTGEKNGVVGLVGPTRTIRELISNHFLVYETLKNFRTKDSSLVSRERSFFGFTAC
jgi:hypothetical protein